MCTYPVVKLAGISLGSNSYCNATCTAYFAKVTEPRVATLGLTPAIPAIKKYVLVKSKRPEKVKAFMLFAALISANSFTQVLEIGELDHVPASPVMI